MTTEISQPTSADLALQVLLGSDVPTLDRLLHERGLAVLDVVAGAAPGTRRLYVGLPASPHALFAVALPYRAEGVTAVDNEAAVLQRLADLLPPTMAATVPRVVEHVEGPAAVRALMVTAVPGEVHTWLATDGGSRRVLDGAVDWLSRLWSDTAGERQQVRLGAQPVEVLVGRYAGVPMVPAVATMHRARQRVAELEVATTTTHGCLCGRHVRWHGGTVAGVDDWGRGAVAGDPLADLGRLAVALAGAGIPEVMGGRSQLATQVRRAVSRGLEALSAPRRVWRDVLLLALLESATEQLDRGDATGVNLLRQTLLALPASS